MGEQGFVEGQNGREALSVALKALRGEVHRRTDQWIVDEGNTVLREDALAAHRAAQADARRKGVQALPFSEPEKIASRKAFNGWLNDGKLPPAKEQLLAVVRVMHREKNPGSPVLHPSEVQHWEELYRSAENSSPRSARTQAATVQLPAPRVDPSLVGDLVVVGRIPRRAPHFVDRAQVGQLRQTLTRDRVAVVVCGMRGAGKTQVAAAYVWEVIGTDAPGLVGWVNAESRDSALTGLAEIATAVGVADPEGDSLVSARRLRDHLTGRREPALLVLDNAEDPDFLEEVVPGGGVTRVVITSTDRAFTGFGQIVDVGEGFARPESVRYLTDATRLDDPDGGDSVAAQVGDLPLALAAAAATITTLRLDYPHYLELLAAQPLPNVLPRPHVGYRMAVDQALLLAINTVTAPTSDPDTDARVRWLVGVMAMLAPDGVDVAMLPDPDHKVGAAITRCVQGSVLSWSATGRVLVMHRLTGRVIRERANTSAPTTTELAAAATAVLAPLLFHESEAFQRREEGSRLIEHIEALWEAINNITELDRDIITTILNARWWATRQLIKAADTTRSITQAERTLADCERVLGADHPNTLSSRDNLALAYQAVGRLSEAIPLYQRNLADYEQILGADHPATLISCNNLALAYQAVGRLSEAIPLYQRNLTDTEQVLGADHPNTLISRNNLAYVYQAAGRMAEAIDVFERTLADRERVLGIDHPDTLGSRNNLASAYQAVGRLGEAIPLYQRNLADYEQVLGADHPDTLSSRNNLASGYRAVGRLGEAIPLLERTLADRERVLGADHPNTLISRNNLARAYQAVGRLSEAIPLLERTLADRERVLGADHPNTLISRNNLAYVYQAAGRMAEAIDVFERTLADRERVLGIDHPDTLGSRNNLASAYESAGRMAEAIPLFERNLADYEQVLGIDHPDTLGSRNNLAYTYESAGRMAEAIPLFERSLADRERVLGLDHPDTLGSRNNLAKVYQGAGRLDEAIPLFERTLTDTERVLGFDHPNTLTFRNNLAGAYRAAGRLDEAIPLYERTLTDVERTLGPDHPTTGAMRDNLAGVQQQTDGVLEQDERDGRFPTGDSGA